MNEVLNNTTFGVGGHEVPITDHEFLWLKHKRAALFAWLKLKLASFQEIAEMSNSQFLPTVPEGARYFDFIAGANGPCPSSKADQEVRAFFDNWIAGSWVKRNLLSWLENAWSEAYLRNLTLKWLFEKDEEQCQWAWGYLGKKGCPCVFFKPNNSRDLCLFSQAIIDGIPSWDGALLFATKFKKAWDQQVYRRKQEGRSSLNTYISHEAKAMLDSISEQRGERIGVVIENMIMKTYRG